MFPDMPKKYSHEFYIMKASGEKGFIAGDDKGRARPFDTITLAEAAAIITRMIGANEGNADPSLNEFMLTEAGQECVREAGTS